MHIPRFFAAVALLVLLAALVLTAAGAQNAARSGAGPLIPASGPLKGETLYTNSHTLLVGVSRVLAHTPW